jgi:hypothetical protein
MKKRIYIDALDRYHNIGDENSLRGQVLSDYINFMAFRFSRDLDQGYAEGWAKTFKDGTELERADPEGRRILRWVNEAKYSQMKKGKFFEALRYANAKSI